MPKKKDKEVNSNSLKARLTDNSIPDREAESQPITETLEINYMPYAMSVIVSRAIPEIDGFKPSHRKLLYTMYKMGLINGNRTKSANVVGQTMKLNPHGDQAIYETMVRLTRGNGALLHPYVDSKGNFGKQYSRDMQYAASRYTEVRLEKICEELFKGIDKDAVDMIDNYDGTLKEPVLLPATFPSVLVNNNQGIAVGMASNICSFNLKEVCDATIAYLKDPDFDILEVMPAPDFSGGGLILYDKAQMQNIYDTGKGSVVVRSKYTIDKKNNLIEITEIPYSTSSDAIIDNIADLVKQGKAKEINDIRDETDLDGLKITIDCKRGTDHEALMTKLFRFTKLQDSFSCNFNILINGNPRVLGVKEIINEWLIWRRECLAREYRYDLGKKKDKLHLLEGLEKILLDIDKAISIIRNTELEEDVVPNLMQGFGIDKVQADYVAEIKLRNINKQYIINRVADREKLEKDIADIEDILAKPKRIDKIIAQTLEEVSKKYAQPRRSELIMQESVQTYVAEENIPEYRVHLMLTRHGYMKKLTMQSLNRSNELKIKDDDEIFMDIEAENKSEILFFSDRCNVYKAKTYEFADTKPSEFGSYLANDLQMEDGERIVFMHVTTDYKGKFMIGFKNGKAALFPVNVYETKQNRKKLINAFSDKSEAVSFLWLADDEDPDLVARSDLNKAAVFQSSLVPLKTTRTTQGVQLLVSKRGSQLVDISRLAEVGINDPEYYRIRRIPAIGYYIKEDSFENKQIGLDI
ncbi:DNA gyrase subunit A [Ruminococcaceae bacterium KH2T8]|nr:DNA gyrase subunit A [Ruminococcaceae bacterium KH2T8]